MEKVKVSERQGSIGGMDWEVEDLHQDDMIEAGILLRGYAGYCIGLVNLLLY